MEVRRGKSERDRMRRINKELGKGCEGQREEGGEGFWGEEEMGEGSL